MGFLNIFECISRAQCLLLLSFSVRFLYLGVMSFSHVDLLVNVFAMLLVVCDSISATDRYTWLTLYYRPD